MVNIQLTQEEANTMLIQLVHSKDRLDDLRDCAIVDKRAPRVTELSSLIDVVDAVMNKLINAGAMCE